MARRCWLFLALLALFLRGSVQLFTGVVPSRPRSSTARGALDAEGLASFASFSVVAGSPIPLALGALLRKAEVDQPEVQPEPEAAPWFSLPNPFQVQGDATPAADGTPEPRDLMWAFPSFAIFLEKVDETAPSNFPLWARWLCLLTFWPGVIWYLYYKLLVEDCRHHPKY
eukprot:Skav233069  [mRNA]  locus=scaffold1468:178149:179028:- [translate_table: standard]